MAGGVNPGLGRDPDQGSGQRLGSDAARVYQRHWSPTSRRTSQDRRPSREPGSRGFPPASPGQEQGRAGQRVRGAARPAEYRELLDSERVRYRLDISRDIGYLPEFLPSENRSRAGRR